MRGDVLWPLLFGSALTLVTTLVAQWSSLAYQTRRQREARRADSQRAALLQLRDALLETEEIVARAMDTRRRLALEFEKDNRDPDEFKAFLTSSHPDQALLSGVAWRLDLLASSVDHEPLRDEIGEVAMYAYLAPLMATDEEAEEARDTLGSAQSNAAELLGEQLRHLP